MDNMSTHTFYTLGQPSLKLTFRPIFQALRRRFSGATYYYAAMATLRGGGSND